ncbi:hypothetical protein AAFC00_004465 [Neodothiora populina]|uniref:STF2-like protein n=1 Tax=Neodothiora populina TaxID=2781224 RepID=A0ABR3P2W9_9PEZI
MTRSHKMNDRDHVGLANGTASPEEHLPRYFAKSGREGDDPKSAKKMGFGRGNWGREMDELEDYTYNSTKPSRRSNSFGHNANAMRTKFEVAEEAPVFEEAIHGASAPDYQSNLEGMEKLEKQSTSSSMDSVEENKE